MALDWIGRATARPYMLAHELGRLHKHAARTAGRVEDVTVVGFDDLHDQLDERGGGEKLAAAMALAEGELAQEIFVDLAEGVAFDIHGNGIENLEQFKEHTVFEAVVGLGEHAAQVLVFGLDGGHGIIDFLTHIGAFGLVEQGRKAGRFGQEHHPLWPGNRIWKLCACRWQHLPVRPGHG